MDSRESNRDVRWSKPDSSQLYFGSSLTADSEKLLLYFSAMATAIRALIFDFDGLILDTESTELGVWKRIYAEYGFEYPLDLWGQNVGKWGNSAFDPVQYLHDRVRTPLDMEALRKRHHDESALVIEREPVADGLDDYMTRARRLGMRLGVASSSPRYWVESHLTRLGLVRRFDGIVTAENVAPGRVKPNPDIYLKALETLGVRGPEAIAFEDSPTGLAAARAAGIFAVAVPNPASAQLDLSRANLVLKSFRSMPLDELLRRAAA